MATIQLNAPMSVPKYQTSLPVTTNPNVINLDKTKKKKSAKEIRANLPAPLKFITSPNLSGFLTGVLTTITTGNPVTGVKAGLVVAGVAGAVQTSPKIADWVAGKATNPAGAGEAVGQFVENPEGAWNKTKDFISDNKTAVAVTTAGVAIAGAGAYVASKMDDIPTIDTPSLPMDNLPAPPAVSGGMPTTTQDAQEAISPFPAPLQLIPQDSGTTTRKKRKKAKASPPQRISQRVDIDIINNNSAHRKTINYINNRELRN